jgi:hypothetical protein
MKISFMSMSLVTEGLGREEEYLAWRNVLEPMCVSCHPGVSLARQFLMVLPPQRIDTISSSSIIASIDPDRTCRILNADS